jgi:hypothetical protein
MATLEELEKRVEAVECRLAIIEPDLAEIPRIATMHFDLLRTEMRGMERRIRADFKAEIDAGIRAI